ncbi:OmpA/MotB family protein, partial [Enterococcus casseliflavus]|uniref:OmpA/MotB family protein n=1 Tax=Enterococcus casseliflavus TaxID=37734 RepID=UPI003D14F027
ALSTARAANVVRYLITQGFPPNKLQVAGFGDTRPKAVNRDTNGNPIPANQELNRRVVVRLIKGDDN